MKRVIIFAVLLLTAMQASAVAYTIPIGTENFSTEAIDASDSTQLRLTFTDALHKDNLPYIHCSMALGTASAQSVSIEIQNAEYKECTPNESALIQEATLSERPQIESYESVTKHKKYIEIEILPFIKRDGRILRVVKASLIVRVPEGAKKDAEAGPKQQYAENSVLSSGDWFKIAVSQSGIYRLTYSDIQSMGVGDPANVRIYGYGGALIEEDFSKLIPRCDDLPEVPIYMDYGADGIFSEGDYILFYAQGSVKDNISESSPVHSYTPNYYSNNGYYFVTCSNSGGKKIRTEEAVTADATINYSTTYAGHYIHRAEYNLLKSGREWYGYIFQNRTLNQTFQITDTNIDTSQPLLLNVSVVTSASSETYFDCALNGQDVGRQIKVASSASSTIAGCKGELLLSLENNVSDYPSVTLNYNNLVSGNIGYLNHITANYYKRLVFDSNNHSLFITNPEDLNVSEVAEYSISGATKYTQVWEITDLSNITAMPLTLENSTAKFKERHNTLHKYIAFNGADGSIKPTMIGRVGNQNLHSLPVADMVIITPAEYRSASERLAQFHRTSDGMSVHVITPDAIYNEFSSGTPDASAYRLFMKMLYDRAKMQGVDGPECLLFMGVASYDNRGILNSPLPLLSFQSKESLSETSSYTTDDFYGMLDDNEGGSLSAATMDISVGRMPVTSAKEAENVVTKTINYVTSSQSGSWRSLCSFLADDGNNNIHMQQANNLADALSSINNSYSIDKVFLDSYTLVEGTSGNTFPGAQEKILNNIKNGNLIFTYVGHGSPNTLTSEQTITRSIIKSMYNKNLGLWITATCDFSRYDDNTHSAGMEVILNPSGGGIALYTTTRMVYSSENYKLMQATFKYIIPTETEEHKTLGEIFRLAKIAIGSNSNKLNFTLLGDPAIKLHYPTNRVITDEINSVEPSEATMQALGIVTIKGHIEDLNGNRLNDYNGSLSIIVYDKEEEVKTKGQTGNPFTYTTYPNKLFIGNVSVINGEFSTTFMVPKDISYRYGNGKILYYLWRDDKPDDDGFGNNTEFMVGGSDPSATPSEDGPNVRIYMNSPEFVSGSKVNENPVFYAHLYDNFGINVVGAGIGHDVTVQLNGDPSQTYILNNYYEAAINNYTSGTVKYQFTNLKPGNYQLNFKAWNLQNVSTSASLEFIVDNSIGAEIEDFTIYPNPATTETTFALRHNRPEVPVTVTFRVYDMLYREYWEATVTESTDGTYTAHWDLTGKFGNMASGIYYVRALVTTANEVLTYKVGKIIIKTQ